VHGGTAFSCEAAPVADARCCVTGVRVGAVGSGCSRPAKRFGLDAARRLSNKAQFERLLRDGRRIKVAGYTFYLEQRNAGAARLGLLVTRKHSALAVERNRIKRCVREAFRLEQARLGSIDVLVRPPYGIRPSPRTVLELRAIFATLSAA
jgi:ribonuclease P protein component